MDMELIALRQAWYAEQITLADNSWRDQFGEMWHHDEDVPDADYYVALWLAEREPPSCPVRSNSGIKPDRTP